MIDDLKSLLVGWSDESTKNACRCREIVSESESGSDFDEVESPAREGLW